VWTTQFSRFHLIWSTFICPTL